MSFSPLASNCVFYSVICVCKMLAHFVRNDRDSAVANLLNIL